MKRVLLGTSVLFGVAMLAGPAMAEGGIELTVGGHFKEAYMVVSDDDNDDELGNERNTDGLFNDAEIDFTGTTVLDNGLEVGAHIELEGETSGDPIDESYIWFAGGFGEFRFGSDDEALHKACVTPPGGSSNFSAFSPNQWGSNGSVLLTFFGGFQDNSICTGVDDQTDAQKVIYTSPSFAGFQLTASYTPESGAEDHTDGAGPHLGMPAHIAGQSRHNTSVALNYGYDGGSWGLEASLGGAWQGRIEEDAGSGSGGSSLNEQDSYQAGVNLYVGNFAFGIGGEFYNDLINFSAGDTHFENDTWVAGGGASYTHDAWVFGVQYSHHEENVDINSGGDNSDFTLTQDRVAGTTSYLLGPGMNLDASIAYTWIDSDPEFDLLTGNDIDDYQSLELGIGATLTF